MKNFFIVGVATAAILVGCGSQTEAKSSEGSQTSAAQLERERAFDEMFAAARNDPDLGSGLNMLASTFPADFERFRQDAHDRFVSGGDGAQMTYVARTVIGQVVAREMPSIGRAPDDYLINYAYATRDAYRVIGDHNPEVCNMIASGVMPEGRSMDIATVRAFSRTFEALLQAAAASRVRPVERQLGPPSSADIDLYVEALSRTDITAADAALIDDPQLIAQADPVTSCRVRRILMDGVINLPPATASRFVASMLKQNVSARTR